MPWKWNEQSHRYHDSATGRFLSKVEVLGYVQDSLDSARTAPATTLTGGVNSAGTDLLSNLVGNGMMNPRDWHEMMREEIKREYIRQYLLGRGGEGSMTSKDWGSIGGMLADQYRYLKDFAKLVQEGALSEGQIRARAAMYANSAREGFERGQARSYGIPDGALPAHPGDGQTQCLCITTPLSRVLTKRGWLPLFDVQVGDLVLTHRNRWRPVIALVAKPSLPGCKHAAVKAPTGQWIGCTADHLWFTPGGWQDSNDIDSLLTPMYHTPIPIGGMKYAQESMQDVWSTFAESYQGRSMQIVSVGMCLREAKGLPGYAVLDLRFQQESQRTMEEQGHTQGHGEGAQGSRRETPHTPRGSGRKNLASAQGRAALELVLARGGEQEKNDLPLPVGVDHGQWPDSRRICDPSQERQSIQRCPGESGASSEWEACQASWADCTQAGDCQDARMDLPELWEEVQALSAWQEWRPEILFTGVLSPGTALYDLVVEEDASFVIEGLIAHNTNCACNWEIEEVYEGDVLIGWNCYWTLGIVKTEHCPDCLANTAKWNPLFITAGGEVVEGPATPEVPPVIPEGQLPTGKDATTEKMNEWLTRGLGTTDWTNATGDQRAEAKREIIAILSERTGIAQEDVNRFVEQWSKSSNDGDMRSLAIQRDAAKEFNIPLSQFTQGKIDMLEQEFARYQRIIEGKEELGAFEFVVPEEEIASPIFHSLLPEDDQRHLLRAMYDNTQEQLHEVGLGTGDTVRLWRGVLIETDYKKGDEIEVAGNTLESWSTSIKTASDFARGAKSGIVLEMDVPIEMIMGSARTGFGCLTEGEFVLLGSRGHARVVEKF